MMRSVAPVNLVLDCDRTIADSCKHQVNLEHTMTVQFKCTVITNLHTINYPPLIPLYQHIHHLCQLLQFAYHFAEL